MIGNSDMMFTVFLRGQAKMASRLAIADIS
jgi:hypothetical protein